MFPCVLRHFVSSSRDACLVKRKNINTDEIIALISRIVARYAFHSLFHTEPLTHAQGNDDGRFVASREQ